VTRQAEPVHFLKNILICYYYYYYYYFGGGVFLAKFLTAATKIIKINSGRQGPKDFWGK
jgi:hypothetical protein